MKFELENVFTCLNAESLKIGSKVIFADDLDTLKQVVKDYDEDVLYSEHNENKCSDYLRYTIDNLYNIRESTSSHRFVKHNEDDLNTAWILAYLLEEPKEPQYKPFDNDTNLLLKQIKQKNSDRKKVILAQDKDGIYILGVCEIVFESYFALLNAYTFMDDSPCGVKL